MLNLGSSFERATYLSIRRQVPINAFAVVWLLLDLFFTLFNNCPWKSFPHSSWFNLSAHFQAIRIPVKQATGIEPR